MRTLAVSTLLLFVASAANGQNYGADARRIALGGIGQSANIASDMVPERRPYGAVVIPLGSLQVLSNTKILNPDNPEFDPLLAMEYAASPLHYTFGRHKGGGAHRLVGDVVNARLNRDLNAYRVFELEPELVAEGLAHPSGGKTFKVRQDGDLFHGIFVGAGPYLALRTDARVDPRLVQLLGASTNTYFPNSAFAITDTTTAQMAAAITGGYRARLPLPGGGGSESARSGTYLAANYHYLWGFRFEQFGLTTRFDTDQAGLLIFQPATQPLVIDRLSSSSGRGFAVDAGVAFVVDRWNFGFGASGIANRIDWKNIGRDEYALRSLISGGDFVHTRLAGIGGVRRLELPVVYATDVGYDADRWAATAEYANGFQGHSLHGGFEYRFEAVELRGGGRYSRERWYPSGGAGFNFSERFGLDVALFGTSTFIERERQMSLAISLRFNQDQ